MPKVEEAIVLVGGLGTRLRSVVADLPKPLAPVAGRPFIAWLLDQLVEEGVRRIILATGYMAEKVEAQMGHQWRGASIAYSREDEPLGTGGAVRLATRHLLGSGALVTNGDTFMRFSPADLEQKVQALGVTMGIALAQVSDVSRYGAVDVVAGRVMALREKGGVHAGQINAGSYFLTPDAISALPQDKTFSFETEVLLPASRRGEVAALEGGRDFIDIGVPEDYARAQQLFAQCT